MKNYAITKLSIFFYLILSVVFLPSTFAEENAVHQNDWYISQPADYATIQMSGHELEEEALRYIKESGLSGPVGYYQTQYKNKPWYAVTYGLYTTLDEARKELKSLPGEMQRDAPWPRTFKAITALIDISGVKVITTSPQLKTTAIEIDDLPSWEEGQAAYDQGDFELAFKIWLALASKGDELSQFNLGVMYSRGEGAEKNIEEAINWYIKSAKQGYAPAQFNLGTAYLSEGSSIADQEMAVKWWQAAGEQGFVQAQFNLASLYCQGIGVEKNRQTCKFWYRKAASNGDTHARKILDHLNSTDKSEISGMSDDSAVGVKIKETAPSNKDADSVDAVLKVKTETATQTEKKSIAVVGSKDVSIPKVRRLSTKERKNLRKAQAAFTRNKYTRAHDLWLPLAESGIAEAQYSLAFLYQSGWGLERNLQKAVAWYSSAAEQNEARAQFNLGLMLLNGDDGIEKDAETGMLWLTRSAENNNVRAKEFLITVYSQGEYGIDKSEEKAEYWRSR